MHVLTRNRTGWLLMLAACAAPCSAASKGLVLELEQLGGGVLPFQAVRLRVTLRSVAGNAIGPLPLLPDALSIDGIKGPDDASFRPVEGTVFPFDPPFEGEDVVERTMILQPRAAFSTSFALGAEWGRDVRPLFPKPGAYVIRCAYSGAGAPLSSDPVTIEVSQPVGADAEVASFLADRPDVVRALLSPIDAPDQSAADLIRDRIPARERSSYGQYARFALARAVLQGARPGSDLTEADRRRAIELLAHVDPEFPLAVHALIVLERVSPAGSPDATEAARTLATRFADALELDLDRDRTLPPDAGGPPAGSSTAPGG